MTRVIPSSTLSRRLLLAGLGGALLAALPPMARADSRRDDREDRRDDRQDDREDRRDDREDDRDDRRDDRQDDRDDDRDDDNSGSGNRDDDPEDRPDDRGDDSRSPDDDSRPSGGDRIRNITVTYPDGWVERIVNGQYELIDNLDRQVIRRPATAEDFARMMALG